MYVLFLILRLALWWLQIFRTVLQLLPPPEPLGIGVGIMRCVWEGVTWDRRALDLALPFLVGHMLALRPVVVCLGLGRPLVNDCNKIQNQHEGDLLLKLFSAIKSDTEVRFVFCVLQVASVSALGRAGLLPHLL